MARTVRAWGLVAAVAALALVATIGEAVAQSSVMRAQTRVVERAISRQAERAFRPKLVVREGATGPVTALSLSPDEHFLVTAVGDGSVRLWDLDAGREVARFAGLAAGVVNVRVSSDGKTVAVVGKDGSVRLFATAGESQPPRVLAGLANARWVLFDHASTRLITADTVGGIQVWDLAQGTRLFEMGGGGAVTALVLSADDKRLYSAAGGAVGEWDMDSHSGRVLSDAGTSIAALAIAGAGAQLVGGGADGAVHRWDITGGGVLAGFGDKDSPLRAVAASESQGWVATAAASGAVKLWDLGSGKLLKDFGKHEGAANFVQIDKDGQYVVSGGEDGMTKLWSVASGQALVSLLSTKTGWAVVDGKGRFEGSEESLAGIDWQDKDVALNVDNFSAGYYEPGLLRRSIKGEALTDVKSIPDGVPLPPKVAIQTRGLGTEAREVVEVAGEDQGGGVADVRLYQNGKLVSDQAVDTKTETRDGVQVVTKSYQVPLVPGENRLSAVGTNQDRVESPPATTVVERAGQPNVTLRVITVGLNKYLNPDLNLNYGQVDAAAIEQFFLGGKSPAAHVVGTHFFDENATKANILAAIAELRNASPEDMVVIYLAGHGVAIEGDWYFLPYEMNRTDDVEFVRRTALSAAELKAAIDAVAPQRITLLIDACQSGTAVTPLRDFRGIKVLRLLARSSGLHILAATDRDQFAVELDKLGHGIFTYALLGGLGGKADFRHDGRISVREVMSYVEDQVPALSGQYANYRQFPISHSRGSDFTLQMNAN